MNAEIEASVRLLEEITAVPTILDVVCRSTGMGFAAVARVTEDRWIACSIKDDIAFGLEPGGELDIETTICSEVRALGEPVIIDHVADDRDYRDHPTPAMYGFQSYISMPIVMPDGRFFGTLCAIDPRPARLREPHVLGMFKLFAELIAFHLDALEKIEASRVDLVDARKASALREQFIAVLGHDLRNPLAAIEAGVGMLEKETLSERGNRVASLIHRSVGRMSRLIDDISDFARGRLGGGISLSRRDGVSPQALIEQVIAELLAAHPESSAETEFRDLAPINGDPSRLSQLFSNLIANAVTHGIADRPVRVTARITNGRFEFTVANSGAPIPPAAMKKLFEPFARGDVRSSEQGLGLGLYIAFEIARAHGGKLVAQSTPEETRFTFDMPVT